jgi:benzoate/toluate 1,2-dioxygenase alpha subunit
MSRGAMHWVEGADPAAREIDLHPLLSGVRTEDEGLFVLQHKYWQDTMLKALAAEQSKTIPVEAV